MRKRWGSVLLALVMVLSVLPAAAFAEDGSSGAAYVEGEDPNAADTEDEDPNAADTEDEDSNAADTEDEDSNAADMEDEDSNAADMEGEAPGAVYAESRDFTIQDGVLTKYSGRDSIVTIPEGVTSIGDSAFYNNWNITSVTIPDSVTSIGMSAFAHCWYLTTVTIPERVTDIANAAFANCKSLTDVTIPSGVTNIANNVFENCESLASLTIPENVTGIGMYAFRGCTELADVKISAKVASIGGYAFSDCGSLKHITIPASVQEIGWRAFSGCTGLTGVTILEGIARIGDHVFLNCSSLTSVTIPASVTEIKWGVFEGCSSLTEINVSEGNLAYISENGVLFNSDKTVLLAFPGGRGGSYEIPGTVTTILAAAFSRCGLTSVTIPASVTGIGLSSPDSTVTEDIFQSCENLAKIEVSESNSKYASIDGVLFNKDKTELIVYPGGRQGNYTIPDTVTTIGSNAFWSCKGLTGLTISDGVRNISSRAFFGCTSLICVTISEGVSEISDRAFQGCDSLAVVYYGGTEEQWSQIRIVESGNDRLLNADIHYNSTGPQDRQCPEEMTYSFGNYDGAFGYPEGLEAFVDQSGKTAYKIRRERYTAIFGNTPLADALYSKADPWGGSCFGMSTTSAMFFQDGNGISVKAFNSAASIPKNLTVSDQNTSWNNLKLREFIETMQVAWSDERICSNYNSSANDLGALCDAVKSFCATGMNPPVVTVYGTINGEKSGHAMLAYDLVEAEDGESHLKVYDPNYPEIATRYITLNQSNGSWSYSMNNQYNWSETDPNGRISFVPYSDFYEVWNGRPNAAAGRTAFTQADENQRSALLFLNSGNAEIYDANGSKVAEIKDGQLQSNHRQDIFQMIPIDAAETGTSAGNTALYLPPDLYTVKNTGNSTEKFEATMVHVDQSAAVSTSGSSVTFAVNDRTEVNFARVNDAAPDTAYTVTMLSTPKSGSEKLDTLTVSGQIGQGAPSIARVFGERFAENLADAVVTDCGAAVPQDQLKDGGTLDVSKIAGASGEITAALQADGTVVLSTVPASVQSVYAASYNSDGRMTGIVIGTLSGRTITFQGSVTKGGQIFLLDENRAPVCGRITIR